DNAVPDDGDSDEEPKPVPLAIQRREAVLAILRESGARSVGDLGCGDGALTRHLIGEKDIDRVIAADVSARALAITARRLRLERRAQRRLRDDAGGAAPSRSPVGVDAGAVPPVGGPGRRRVWVRRPVRAGRPRGTRGRPADPAGGVHPGGGGMTSDTTTRELP